MTNMQKEVAAFWVAVVLLLCGIGYKVGYWSLEDDRAVNHMPTVMFDIISTRNDGKSLAVRRVNDGKTGYLEGNCSMYCPKFDVGERVTMERWKSPYGNAMLVYHWQYKEDDTTYFPNGDDDL